MGYKIYVPDLKEIIVGVNCIFNEVIPSYREEYFQELSKLRFEMSKDESTVESFEHFVGIRYHDDEVLLEFVTTRVIVLQGVIVAYRAPVNKDGRVGFEEKSPIHIGRCTNDRDVYIQTQRRGVRTQRRARGSRYIKGRDPTRSQVGVSRGYTEESTIHCARAGP